MAKKSADAFRTISEVSDALDTPAHVLRFWESKFSQIKPVKRAGGRRYYRPDDIDLLNGIRTLLHEQGMTIKGAQKLLREKGVKHVAAIAPISGAGLQNAAASLEKKSAKTKAPKAEEPKTANFDFEASAPDSAADKDLPDITVGATPIAPSMISLVARAPKSNLAAKAEELAPVLAKLEALHERMQAS